MAEWWKQFPSINHSSRAGFPVELGLIHASAGGNGVAMTRWLQQPSSQKSYHLKITRSGDVHQLVPLDKRAWHAGVSECVRPSTGETESDLNDWSVGICLDNWLRLHRTSHGQFLVRLGSGLGSYVHAPPQQGCLIYDDGQEVLAWWEPYPEAQIQSLIRVCDWLYTKSWCSAFVGHEETAMPLGRRQDPGPLFPWYRLQDAGLPRLHPARTWTVSYSRGLRR